MKPIAAISIAALVAALVATPALALDVNAGLNANAGASNNTNSTSLDLGVTTDFGVKTGHGTANTSSGGTVSGSVASNDNVAGNTNASADARLDALIKLVDASQYHRHSFSGWADASATTVINTDGLFDVNGQTKLDAAVKAHWTDHQDLGAAIDANAKLKAWLGSNNIDANSVIAIEAGADGSVHVYEG